MITLEELENRIDSAQSTLALMQDVVQGLKTNIEELKEEQKEPIFDLYEWNPCTIKLPDHVLQDIKCNFVAVLLTHKDVYKEYCKDVEGLPVDASSVQDGSLFLGYMCFSLSDAKPTFKYANGSPIFDKGSEEKRDPKNYYFKYVFGGI